MTDWQFDKVRWLGVLKAVQEGWTPGHNLFAVYQLRESVAEPATIEAALTTVGAEAKREASRPTWAGPANLVLRGHGDARATLLDPARRGAHAEAIRRRREPFRAGLLDSLSKATQVPDSAVKALVRESRGELVTADVEAVLAELGIGVREPVDYGPVPPPRQWAEIKKLLGESGHPSLTAYLAGLPEPPPGGSRRPSAGPCPDRFRDRLEERRSQLSGVSGTTEGREVSLLTVLSGLTGPELSALLKNEVLESLRWAATTYRYPEVLQTARRKEAEFVRAGLTVPPDDLAYAVWCERRHPSSPSRSTWQRDLERARAARDWRAAVAALSSAGVKLSGTQRRELEELRTTVESLERDLRTAASLEESDPEGAAELYLAVDGRWSDPRARAGLARCVPAPPRRVDARVEAGRAVVTWTPSPARAGGVTYDVVRACDHLPATPADGHRLSSAVTSPPVVDPSPPSARKVFYAVFAVRASVAVSAPAGAGPVLVLAEVEDLVVEAGVNVIDARYRAPAGASAVEVSRAPAAGGAAVTVDDVRLDGFSDRRVRPGESYAYHVRVRYVLPDGGTVCTRGLHRQGSCQVIPRPVEDLHVTGDDDGLVLSWTPPPDGQVEILVMNQADAVPRQQVAPWAAVRSTGRPLDGVTVRARDRLRARPAISGGRLVVVPVTVVGQLAAVGRGTSLERAPRPVTGLRAISRGRIVELRWVWPDGASEARVLHSDREIPADPHAPVPSHDVTRARYERMGVRLPLPAGLHHFAVCTVTRVDGTAVYSPLATVSQLTVREVPYRISAEGPLISRLKGRPPGRFRTLTVGTDDGPPLPPMLLLAKSHTRPMSRADGHEVARWDGGVPRLVGRFRLPGQLGPPVHLRLFSLEAGVTFVDGSG